MPVTSETLAALEREAAAAVAAAPSVQALVETRARFLGRKGSLSAILRGVGELPPAERAALGALANAAKERIEACVGARREELERAGVASALSERRLDVTLPGVPLPRGRHHPVTRVQRDVARFFTSLGFSIEEGPEVETDWNNFEALNFPPDHPARDMQDTFFVEGGHLLRTHTSPVQIRTMAGRQPPFRFIAQGRVYRHDHAATKSPIFHQVEGFIVDERTTFADLKGVLYAFARFLMGPEIVLRFRANFFPFTEPSAELDFSWQGGWLEWGGCGMIHPAVLENCGIDSERWQGFAFGMGIDRTAMRRQDIPNIHHLFESDVRVLEQL
jgi:phenylalanyl-tRNA synthetase alpha chain